MAAKAVNQDGEVWAVPAGPFGFCPAVVARRAEPADPVGLSLVYLSPVASPEVPDVTSLRPLSEWGSAWVGLVGRRPFSTKRWTYVGSYPGFEHDDWPMPPWCQAPMIWDGPDGWSVATTGEMPSMTVIANDPALRTTAEGFPHWQVVTAPSALERGLTNLLKQSQGAVFDMVVQPLDVDVDVVRRWRDYGAQVRSRRDAAEPEGLSPGRRTDQSLAGGEWLAFPATGGGFGVGLFLPRPPRHLRVFSDGLVLVFGRVWSTWPTLSEVRQLAVDQAVALAQTSMICVRDGRWRVLGRDTPFDAERWPLPTWWTPSKTNDASIDVWTPSGVLNVPVDSPIIEADPQAGSCWSRSSVGYTSLEAFPSGRFATKYMIESHGVSATRIETWRLINQRVESVLGRPAITLWLDH